MDPDPSLSKYQQNAGYCSSETCSSGGYFIEPCSKSWQTCSSGFCVAKDCYDDYDCRSSDGSSCRDGKCSVPNPRFCRGDGTGYCEAGYVCTQENSFGGDLCYPSKCAIEGAVVQYFRRDLLRFVIPSVYGFIVPESVDAQGTPTLRDGSPYGDYSGESGTSTGEWLKCADKECIEDSGRISIGAFEQFITCTEDLWRAKPPHLTDTPNKYPFKCGGDPSADDHPLNANFPEKWGAIQLPNDLTSSVNEHGFELISPSSDDVLCNGDHDSVFHYTGDLGRKFEGRHSFNEAGIQYTGIYSLKSDCPGINFDGSGADSLYEDAMALLFGNGTSVGQVCSVAKAITKNGWNSMPGSCCLDSAFSPSHFGFKYECGRKMTCDNPGPWLSGFSMSACDHQGGTWCRSPCTTLQHCTSNKPGINDTHYSAAFDNFASGMTITDPADEDQCQSVRVDLGYEPDYIDDNEICEYFNELKCDSLFGDIDDFGVPTQPLFPDFEFPEFEFGEDSVDQPFKELQAFDLKPTPEGESLQHHGEGLFDLLFQCENHPSISRSDPHRFPFIFSPPISSQIQSRTKLKIGKTSSSLGLPSREQRDTLILHLISLVILNAQKI